MTSVTGPGTPHALLQQAMLLQQTGRFGEAEAAYKRLLAQWPDLPDCWYNLGFLQRQAGRFDAALLSYEQALARGASQPEEIHLNRSVIYADHLRQDDAAERELNAALRLNPNYVPALLNLANLNEDRGRKNEALTLYEKALARDPNCHIALARAASLTKLSGPDDPMIGRLRRTLSLPTVTAADKANLAFALGAALDSCGSYDQAFDAYTAANRYSRESATPQRPLYDRQRHEQFIEQLIGTFTPGLLKSAASTSSAPPIFICGMFRSGSTLAEQVLAAHPRVTAGGELGLLPALVRSDLTPFPSVMTNVSAAALERLAERYLNSLSALFPGGDRITDKRPDNFLYIGLIKRMFPDAKIIHTTRNALDNCLSIFFLHLDHSMGYALDLMDTGHYYAQYRRLMAHWRSLYGADILDFDYDAFVHEPRPAVERLLDFCGLAWDENCLQFHRASNTVKTASVWQVREPLYQRSSGRWRAYERHLTPLRTYLDDVS
ncbi:MAG: sulfotransferase [Alphaproteobacteria bacterium]|nr:sulfotransferase [Alphaproteobacteria bacterium]